MRIGINCISIDKYYAGGINAFTFGLLDGFADLSPEDSFVIFVNSAIKPCSSVRENVSNFRVVAFSESSVLAKKTLRRLSVFLSDPAIYRAASNLLFENIIASLDSQCDLLYTPTTVLLSYNSKIPNVLSMHDIQQHHFPQFHLE